jgi:hypothetical protein
LLFEGLLECAELDDLSVDEMFIESGLYFVVSSHNAGAAFVWSEIEFNFVPNAIHFVEHAFDVVLFGGFLSDFDTGVRVFEESDFEYFLEGEFRVSGVDGLANKFLHLGPMSVFHTISS